MRKEMLKRKSTATAPAPSSTKKQKRKAATPARIPVTNNTTPSINSSNRPRRTPSNQITPKRSKYFEHSEEEEESDEASDSGYEDEAASASHISDSDDAETDGYESEEEEKKPAKKGRKPKLKNGTSEQLLDGKNDLWREGVKTGLGPGHQVFIAKPKARGDGGIAYMPEKIHPNTMEFLKDLKKNNDRIWLKAHDADYRTSWKDFGTFVENLTEKITEVDETIPELPPKDLVFRIYRDVRFSSDPTPYKPHFSAAWSRTGRKGPYACYYVQIQPGDRSFVGSGLWHPEAAPVALLRTDIDQRSERIKTVLTGPRMRKNILGGISKDPKKAVKAFCEQNKENALKTKPKGYAADNPNIELLRLRNFTIGAKISDDDIIGPRALDRIVELISIMQPFVSYLNSVVMPDEEAADESSDSSSDEDNAPSE